jgi:hypothetical protein
LVNTFFDSRCSSRRLRFSILLLGWYRITILRSVVITALPAVIEPIVVGSAATTPSRTMVILVTPWAIPIPIPVGPSVIVMSS